MTKGVLSLSIWAITLIIFGICIVITLVVLGVMLSKVSSGLRLKCTDCKHCKKKLIKPPGGKGRGTYISTYCHYLQKDLAAESRCIIKDESKAMFE